MTQPLTPEVITGGAPELELGLIEFEASVVQGRSPYQLAWLRIRRDRVALVSLGVIFFVILLAVFAPLLAHLTGHGVDEQFHAIGETPSGAPKGPTHVFWFGTDEQGRDILVRAAYGARVSLLAGLIATVVASIVGTIVGIAAGYLGQLVDTILSRTIDLVLSLPYLLFAIALVSIVGPSLSVAIIVIAFFSWASIARIVRGQVLSLREREFVEAARSLGASSFRIMFVDVLPNVFAQIIVLATLLIPAAIVFEATLSFLGLGVPPPTPSWGNMISGAELYPEAWWYLVVPSVLLLMTTLAFNLLGDAVRDAFDPRGDRSFAAAK